MAENERVNIRQRQAEGIAAAKKRGVKFGRPEKPTPADFAKTVARWEQKQISIQDAARSCGMSESTFYRRLREYRLTNK